MPALTESFLRKRSGQLLVEKTTSVTIFDSSKEERIPLLSPNEVEFGKILGKGGFCTVSTLENVTLNDENQSDNRRNRQQSTVTEQEFFTTIQDRTYISDNFIRGSDGQHRYALKKLTPGLYEKGDPQHFVCGVIDLAMEVKFLSVLRHPHIIKMRAMADVHHCSSDFFILLDRLNLTLTKQVETWKKEMPSGFGNKKKKEELFCERLIVGYDICAAISHLHEKKIVYRDLKPDNIGFDVRDDVKIFDFGLATEMVEGRRVEGTNTYLLTKDTGSPRYMAPEVFRGIPYNEKCDVYSFSLILWQILELTPPFLKFNLSKMNKDVYNGKAVPKLNSKWNDNLKELFNSCWSRDFSSRPSCEEALETLRNEIAKIDGDATGLLDISNRTELSMKNLSL